MTNSREKGKRGEREAAAEIRRLFGTEARRSVQYCGRNGDSDLTPDAIPGCHVEVKNVAAIGVKRFHDQAASEAPEGKYPIVVMKGTRTPWYVMLKLEDFAKLTQANGIGSGCVRTEKATDQAS